MRKVFGYLLCFFLAMVTTAYAEFIPPGSVHVKTPTYNFEPTPITPGRYVFDVSWQGIPVATASVVVGEKSPDNGQMDIVVSAQTNGVIDVFYKLRHQSESIFSENPVRPVLFKFSQAENSSKKNREISFADGGQINSKQWRPGKKATESNFFTDNNTMDPITAAFVARNMPLTIGAESEVDVYTGKHRYLIRLEVVDQQTIKIGDSVRDAFKVVPTVKKLTDTKGERKLNSAAIWVASDGSRDLLKLESKVWIGSVSAKFIRFEPLTEQPGTSPTEQDLVRARLANKTQ